MKTLLHLPIALWAIFALGTARAEEPSPPPPAYGNAASDLKLDVYRKLNTLWRVASGLLDPRSPPADTPLPPEIKSREDGKKALGEAVTAHRDELLKALGSSQVIHRELSARALGYCTDVKAAIAGLGPSLAGDPDVNVRLGCAAALTQLKDAACVDALLGALQDKEENVRCQAASGLGAIKDNRSAQPLLEVLARDEKSSVRRRAAGALAEIKDPNTLEPLLKAMDAEQDYRVRLAIAAAVRAIRGKDIEATQGLPPPGEHENLLIRLAKDMRGVEDKLRSDRHDQAVQVDQKDIEEKLTKLIEQIEQMQQSSSSSQGQQQGQKQGQKQGQQQGGQQQRGSKRPTSPMTDSGLGAGAERGALNPAEVASHQAEWAKLPPSMRDEILQVDRPGMPERWRVRLVAYYLSLAAEEAQPNR